MGKLGQPNRKINWGGAKSSNHFKMEKISSKAKANCVFFPFRFFCLLSVSFPPLSLFFLSLPFPPFPWIFFLLSSRGSQQKRNGQGMGRGGNNKRTKLHPPPPNGGNGCCQLVLGIWLASRFPFQVDKDHWGPYPHGVKIWKWVLQNQWESWGTTRATVHRCFLAWKDTWR